MIKTSPEYAYYYAKVYIGRWPEAEDVIKTDPKWAYNYADQVLQSKWPEAEDAIKKSPEYASLYAQQYKYGRWPEAENVIKANPFYWMDYLAHLQRLRTTFTDEVKWKWLKEEGVTDILFEILNMLGMSKDMQEYVIQHRPDLTPKIKRLNPDLAKKYFHEKELGNTDL